MDLISKFEDITKMVTALDTEGLVNNDWGVKDREICGLLEAGRDVGVRKYQRILNPDKATEGGEVAIDKVAEEVEKRLYGKESEVQVKGAWGKVARKQEKAAKKLIKAFEMDFAA